MKHDYYSYSLQLVFLMQLEKKRVDTKVQPFPHSILFTPKSRTLKTNENVSLIIQILHACLY